MFRILAIYPNIENMTKPESTLVNVFIIVNIVTSRNEL